MNSRSKDPRSLAPLLALLKDVIGNPAAHAGNEKLRTALNSQGALAAYEDPTRSIIGMSLNHQKKLATDLDGSFDDLDELRRNARSSLIELSKAIYTRPQDTRARLEARYALIKQELQTREEDMLILHRAYVLRCKQARLYAHKAGAAVVALCNREQEELDLSLGLMRRAQDNVVKLAERKKGHGGSK